MPQEPHRLNGAVFVIGSAVLVTIVGVLAALVTWAFHPSTPAQCTADCPPPSLGGSAQSAGLAARSINTFSSDIAPLAPEATYTNSQWGYTITYQSPWSVTDEGPNGVVFQTRSGQFGVVAGQTSDSPVQLIEQHASNFEDQIPDLSALGPILGAHIGTQQGTGEMYGGTFSPSSGSGQSQIMRIGIIVATRNGVTVVATAFVPLDQQQGVPYADDIDYALAEFRWSGQ